MSVINSPDVKPFEVISLVKIGVVCCEIVNSTGHDRFFSEPADVIIPYSDENVSVDKVNVSKEDLPTDCTPNTKYQIANLSQVHQRAQEYHK